MKCRHTSNMAQPIQCPILTDRLTLYTCLMHGKLTYLLSPMASPKVATLGFEENQFEKARGDQLHQTWEEMRSWWSWTLGGDAWVASGPGLCAGVGTCDSYM